MTSRKRVTSIFFFLLMPNSISVCAAANCMIEKALMKMWSLCRLFLSQQLVSGNLATQLWKWNNFSFWNYQSFHPPRRYSYKRRDHPQTEELGKDIRTDGFIFKVKTNVSREVLNRYIFRLLEFHDDFKYLSFDTSETSIFYVICKFKQNQNRSKPPEFVWAQHSKQ